MEKLDAQRGSILAGIFLIPRFSHHAYLDPGSGSFILQVLIAGAAGFAFIMRHQISRFFAMFSRGKNAENKAAPGKDGARTSKRRKSAGRSGKKKLVR